MQKAFSLSSEEQMYLQQLQAQQTEALAAYGAASIDMKTAEARLEQSKERQQTFVRSCLLGKGITQFEQARINNGNIECQLADPPPSAVVDDHKPNGAPPLPLEVVKQ